MRKGRSPYFGADDLQKANSELVNSWLEYGHLRNIRWPYVDFGSYMVIMGFLSNAKTCRDRFRQVPSKCFASHLHNSNLSSDSSHI